MTVSNRPAIPFDNSFARMPAPFYTVQNPTPVVAPKSIRVNTRLAENLGISADWLSGDEATATFAGNHIPDGAAPLAQVYAGHQFGHWNPQLGDGRAVLLGEVTDHQGQRRDIQLKGSGRTPYSRGGDGRAWLGPVLREYVVSEAMHALGIPTTRALAAVTTGQQVQRETALPGAVLTRVAASHIRIGTFQYFAARQDTAALQALSDHVITRHYPDAETPLDLLNGVVARQASLIARWMSVGFIHGVMNTDNMAVSGETIDYGPCAFMDEYHPQTVFSSIDRHGRYGYDQQPLIAVWNLAQFASCLLPLMGDTENAMETATRSVQRFPDIYRREWLSLFRHKLGLNNAQDGDQKLIEDYLQGLAQSRTDFTNGFRDLSRRQVPAAMSNWKTRWLARLEQQDDGADTLLAASNPAFIARNHRIEDMIDAAVNDDFTPFETLMDVLAQPFDDQTEHAGFRDPPTADQVVRQTFCGT